MKESSITWFYNKGGQGIGPFSEDEMQKLIESGVVSRNAQVWAEGFTEWRPVGLTALSRYIGSSGDSKTVESSNSWFYDKGGQRQGPVSGDDVQKLIRTGVISRSTAVWTQGFPEWMSMDETELIQYIDSSIPPPLSGRFLDNTIPWLIAVLPLFWGMVHSFNTQFIMTGPRRGNILLMLLPVVVFFAIYILLYRIDEKQIKAAGHNYDSISPWAWMIPAVYLYQRAMTLGQNLHCFLALIACMIAGLFIQVIMKFSFLLF